ncbi:hypothetical protein D1872_256080 [compost metagenome]
MDAGQTDSGAPPAQRSQPGRKNQRIVVRVGAACHRDGDRADLDPHHLPDQAALAVHEPGEDRESSGGYRLRRER